MKKNMLILLLMVAIISITAYSQVGNSRPVSTENSKYIYCELIQQDYLYVSGTRTETFLKFGSQSTYTWLAEESNYVKIQADGLNALNYMMGRDWELAAKNVREFGSQGIESVYLLKKRFQ